MRGRMSNDAGPVVRSTPLLLYGALLFCLGIATFLSGVLLVVPRYLLGLHALLDPIAE